MTVEPQAVPGTIVSAGNLITPGGEQGPGGLAGAGNVIGPASAVDNQICIFDGSSGKLIKTGLDISYLCPVGCKLEYGGDVAPAGWIFAFGQALLRIGIYANLFSVYGIKFGAGNGTTTFNIPDCRGRTSVGKDDMGGVSADRLTGSISGLNGDILGDTGGVEHLALSVAQMPNHQHLYVSFNSSGPSGVAAGGQAYTQAVNTQAVGGNAAHTNVQPSIVWNVIIKY